MNALRDALAIFRLYRRHRNGIKYSALAAWRIGVKQLPF